MYLSKTNNLCLKINYNQNQFYKYSFKYTRDFDARFVSKTLFPLELTLARIDILEFKGLCQAIT